LKRRFTERMGLVEVKIQTDGMNDRLRSGIWNLVSRIVARDSDGGQSRVIEYVAERCLSVPRQNVPYPGAQTWLLQRVQKMSWGEVYELLEFVVDDAHQLSTGKFSSSDIAAAANQILEREHSGFRFIGGELTRNIDPAEVKEIEKALAAADAQGLDGVHTHIAQALALFGQRPKPDLRNAIKEAISAVEGVVKLIEGVRGGGLDDALDALGRRIMIHRALRDGLVKLYGFTSDSDGIRHPILDEPTIGDEDARFFIVTCSAAVNWVIAKAAAAGLLKPNPR